MKKYSKYLNFLYVIAFIILIIVSYLSSKRKPDSVKELITDFGWLNNFPKWLDAPFMVWINDGWRWFSAKYGLIFDAIGYVLLRAYSTIKNLLVDLPWPLVILLVVIITYFSSGKKIGTTMFVGFCLFCIGFLNPRFWDKAIETTTIVLIGILLCVIVGIPIGIAMARNAKVRNAILPILDLMQVIPSFCYLIPGIILFGLGAIPAIIGIFIYSCPPLIRLTDLGIRLVDKEVIEAAESFGASRKQKLWGVQLPLALPNIMQGINQCTMMALAMVVIASMIGVKGLGVPILRAVMNQYLALGLFNGLAIVAIAIIFDRISQEYGRRIQKHRGIKR